MVRPRRQRPPSLLGTAARTAVVAGTATAVSGSVAANQRAADALLCGMLLHLGLDRGIGAVETRRETGEGVAPVVGRTLAALARESAG